MSRAINSELLDQRIAENASSQEIDLATWIFERVPVRSGERVLELCCGTGGQTLSLLERVGDGGAVVALDISRAALDTLTSKVDSRLRPRLTCVEGSLDHLPTTVTDGRLEQAGTAQNKFDLVFCAYGLYYSADPQRTLNEVRSLLNRKGRIAVIGPFGPNNKPLFDLVRDCGVKLAEPVVYSSELFMLQTVVPWGTRNFESVSLSTMVNPVRWTAPERMINYWQNTTFYDAEKRDEFERRVRAHFERNPAFVNEKWVMLAEMSHVRA